MGGSDVVHCVQVSLTGTTVAWCPRRIGVWLGIGLVQFNTHFVTFTVGMGPLY